MLMNLAVRYTNHLMTGISWFPITLVRNNINDEIVSWPMQDLPELLSPIMRQAMPNLEPWQWRSHGAARVSEVALGVCPKECAEDAYFLGVLLLLAACPDFWSKLIEYLGRSGIETGNELFSSVP